MSMTVAAVGQWQKQNEDEQETHGHPSVYQKTEAPTNVTNPLFSAENLTFSDT
jgi:hypothetical protein